MLSRQDNQLLTNVESGSAMGRLIRRYWIPLLLSIDLPDRDGKPMRMRLLGEDLVAFRDSSGQVGLVQSRCPHRGAALALGRNEEGGIRCVYHGWKFDRSGKCVDLPAEPVDRGLRSRVRINAYRCIERSGIVWAYMGPDEEPSLPDLEWGLVPESHRYVSRRIIECNWAQGLEGDIDTSHASYLHRRLDEADYEQFDRAQVMQLMDRDGHPVFEVDDTLYGLMIAARRAAEPDGHYWRIAQFLFPFVTMPAPYEDMPYRSNVWVPMDNGRTLVWTVDWHPTRPLTPVEVDRRAKGAIGHCTQFLPEIPEPGGRWRPCVNMTNDYLLDYGLQQSQQFSGIREIWAQDKAVAESMGRVADRTDEHLSASDLGIIRWRKRMLSEVRRLDEARPPGLEAGSQLVRSASFVCKAEADWREVAAEHVLGGAGVPIHQNSL